MFACVTQQPRIQLQPLALGRKFGSQCVDKGIVSLHESKRAVGDGHAVESLIKALPRKAEQSQIIERRMKRLSFAQSSHIVKARIEPHPPAFIALDTSARLCFSFK